ncbi:MAG: 4a-hydroxytetrahydrobiopterin dehydratase [Thermoplasmata archaeon]
MTGDGMPRLSEEEIEERLAKMRDWEREGNYIKRTYEFPSFMKAIEFINRVAELAEEADHHPNLENVWRTVILKFTTHDEGGLTKRDFNMASKINAIGIE